MNPLDNLKIAQLRTELERHGYDTRGERKPQLEKEFDTLWKGISYVPALVQLTLQATFKSLKLKKYEVFPTEPLHDLKGHIHYIIEESTRKAAGETKQILKNVQTTVLSKKTALL